MGSQRGLRGGWIVARRTRDYWGQVDEDIYNELGNRATQEGLKIKDLINRYIVEGLQEDAAGGDSNLDSEIFLAVQEARARERRHVLLEQVGATVIKYGDGDDYDNFESLCSKANASVDEILERVKQQRQPHSLPSFDDGTGVRSAVGWLQDVFEGIEGGKRIGSVEIKELGAKAGFSWPTLKAAKQHLSVKSMREGMKWYWVMVDNAKD